MFTCSKERSLDLFARNNVVIRLCFLLMLRLGCFSNDSFNQRLGKPNPFCCVPTQTTQREFCECELFVWTEKRRTPTPLKLDADCMTAHQN